MLLVAGVLDNFSQRQRNTSFPYFSPSQISVSGTSNLSSSSSSMSTNDYEAREKKRKGNQNYLWPKFWKPRYSASPPNWQRDSLVFFTTLSLSCRQLEESVAGF
jgi:hypothetical protein